VLTFAACSDVCHRQTDIGSHQPARSTCSAHQTSAIPCTISNPHSHSNFESEFESDSEYGPTSASYQPPPSHLKSVGIVSSRLVSSRLVSSRSV